VRPAVLPDLRHRWLWKLGGLCLALAVLVLSLLPVEQLPQVRVWDKFQHMLAYVALALWFGSITPRRRYAWIAAGLMAYGAFIELLQGWMEQGRHADLSDLGANATGIAAGLLLALTPLGRWAHWLESWQRQTVP
jgi:hypothetical protein